jgi:hypothetical protein
LGLCLRRPFSPAGTLLDLWLLEAAARLGLRLRRPFSPAGTLLNLRLEVSARLCLGLRPRFAPAGASLSLRLGLVSASAGLGVLSATTAAPISSLAPLGVCRRRDHTQCRHDERRTSQTQRSHDTSLHLVVALGQLAHLQTCRQTRACKSAPILTEQRTSCAKGFTSNGQATRLGDSARAGSG